MKAYVQKIHKKDFTWMIIILLIIIPLIIEFFAGDDLFDNSHPSIIEVQEFMSETFKLKLFENDIPESPINENNNIKNITNYTNSSFFEEMSYLNVLLLENETESNNSKPHENEGKKETSKEEEKKEEKTSNGKEVFISEFIHFINSNNFYLILCAIIYNYTNIYKTFILAITVFSANFISATLSYIFQSPKPYMAFYLVKSAVIFNEWGSPNCQMVVLISFALSLYKVITENKTMEKKQWAKILVMVLLIVYSIIDIFLLFASGNMTYNHIIFSLFISIDIYLVIFHSYKVNLNNAKELYDIIKFNLLYYLVINALLFTFQLLLSNFITDARDTTYYEENGKKQVDRMPSTDFSDNFCGYRKMFFLNEGNLCNVICFLMYIIAFLGLKFDLHYNYSDNFNNWSDGNFEKTKKEKMNAAQGQQVEYSNLEESQWNHYGIASGILRFIATIFIVFVLYALFIWINSWKDNASEFQSFCFLIIIPMALHVFGTFYGYKALFMKLKLARKPKMKLNQLVF